MNLDTLEQLLSPAGQQLLAYAASLEPTEPTFLQAHQKVAKRAGSELAKAAVEIAILRKKATVKFPDAARMYFTRESLEQSSSWAVSSHRAKRFAKFTTVGDLCCGIGGDALAFSEQIANVVALDRDSVRARMAGLNAPKCQVITADVLTSELPPLDAFFCDPSRRVEGKRTLSLADYLPQPQEVLARFPEEFPAAFKLAPGVPWEDLQELPAEFEFISLGRELKECVAWFGPLRTTGRRATLLPSGDSFTAEQPCETPGVCEPKRFIFDPDSAITRAGLVTNLAVELGGFQLDPNIAFLTTDRDVTTPFALRYEVEVALPFHARKIRDWLREHHIGRVTIIKRGSSADADELLKLWKGTGSEHRVVLLTQQLGKSTAIVCRVE